MNEFHHSSAQGLRRQSSPRCTALGIACDRVLRVAFPPPRVVSNVPIDPFDRSLVSNDVLVKASLPDHRAWGSANFVDASGRDRLERTQLTSERFSGRGGSRTARSDVGDGDDAMQVIRHHNPGIWIRNFGEAKHVCPGRIDNLSNFIQAHLPVGNFTKQRGPAISANRYEVQTLGRIVIPAKSHSMPAGNGGIHSVTLAEIPGCR